MKVRVEVSRLRAFRDERSGGRSAGKVATVRWYYTTVKLCYLDHIHTANANTKLSPTKVPNRSKLHKKCRESV